MSGVIAMQKSIGFSESPWYIPPSICSFILGISWFLQVDHCSLYFFIERNFSFAVRFLFSFWQFPNIALEHSWELHPNDNLLMLVCSTGMKMCSLVIGWIWLLKYLLALCTLTREWPILCFLVSGILRFVKVFPLR